MSALTYTEILILQGINTLQKNNSNNVALVKDLVSQNTLNPYTTRSLLSKLCKLGLLSRPMRGVYTLTELGKKRLVEVF